MKKLLIPFLLIIGMSRQAICGRVDTIQIYSTAMHKDIPCVVIVPDMYGKLDAAYPVVYLLHGYSGNYLDWITRVPELKQYVDEFHLIIVCPDGGYSSWYWNSPIDTAMRYETFMTRELVPDIDARYYTIPDREHRGICGLSMGGQGALFLAIRHPEEFGAVASISGGVDIRDFPDNWDIKKRLGDMKTHRENWEKYTVMNLADSLKNNELDIALDDGVHDIFIKQNRELHEKLLSMHIDHDYTERPGGHTWSYWRNAIPYELLFFRKYFYGNE
ncbi:MAG: esterase family protein [Chitinophagaceae bacterium]|nr:MAG: esterase family protein [Chitinophagaceae bacterium]